MTDDPLGVTVCEDGLARPPWAVTPGMMRDYYDTEWGMPVDGESAHFERLCLEGFQSGLSWATILRKRPAFREVFCDFDVDTVAAFGETDVERLLTDARIIRHRGKIEATIGNAAATIALRDTVDGGLVSLLWSFRPERTPTPETITEVPTSSPESVAMSKELRRRGFRFVGPTTMYALMEALGIVDTHLVGSFRRGSSGVWAPDGSPRARR
ncbi:DNA-3-methyladenine glycosylase I [Williamsia herbipolensis]|uniref:DNA-3-methyladenine glycosylase I n=1 Tax=Williamsia herbipolensis TaxID=1603258 RepID=A0AAU4JXI7_9NOCA|nr:DNA-3-methyladenine glycosylase I [Williamsia herbipolensis]